MITTFEYGGGILTADYNPALDYIRVDMSKCGYEFRGVMRVFDPKGLNPMVEILKPLGMNMVNFVMENIDNIKTQ